MAEKWTSKEMALSGKQKEMILMLVKKSKQQEVQVPCEEKETSLLAEEEVERKRKERQIYLELRQKAMDNPFSDVPFFPFGPGCVMPDFAEKVETVNYFELRRQRPLTEEEERRFTPGMSVNLPSLPPLPWDERQFVPLTPEIIQKLEEQEQLAQSATLSSREETRQKLAAEGRCLDGSYLTPYCKCDGASHSQSLGFETLHSPELSQICLAYRRQMRQSHCFDIDAHIGSHWGASVLPLEPLGDFRHRELLRELADSAIMEYNNKECNVFKYKVLKIEKVNFSASTYYQYWMTVKVSNLTLVTPIETFQIHVGINSLDDDDKIIYCCRPKEEPIDGSLPSCDTCFGVLERHAFSW
ncbi:hypothetical protein HAX54_020653 [Datura stramonium]|uniref:Uncharacterized protein n=1 Tax=Datura stramonium TaxID=4076 RepID=A0ABS8S2N3_DATST|nr:hypothetical protein [Datura stramonium]